MAILMYYAAQFCDASVVATNVNHGVTIGTHRTQVSPRVDSATATLTQRETDDVMDMNKVTAKFAVGSTKIESADRTLVTVNRYTRGSISWVAFIAVDDH
jgi:hypothetical protein